MRRLVKDWLSIEKLPRAAQAAIKTAMRAHARHGEGAEDALVFFVAREAYAAGRRREMEKTAKATPNERLLRKHLSDLTSVVRQFVERLDATMAGVSTVDRGREVAALRNALDFANDSARLFGLKIPLEKLGKKPPRTTGALFEETLRFLRDLVNDYDHEEHRHDTGGCRCCNAEKFLAKLEGRKP